MAIPTTPPDGWNRVMIVLWAIGMMSMAISKCDTDKSQDRQQKQIDEIRAKQVEQSGRK